MARKILLADDSVTAQNMGRKILSDAGYEVIAVNNGSAALKKIAELKPDLVILDVYMPGYSGLEVCQRLKESQETARLPVLLSVGKLEPFKPEEAQRVRADAFIVKPFEASELLSALSKLEDKVVPRSEPSKPGRFARAVAAAEESSRGSAKETASDENNGWKNRISFPHERAGEPEEKVADEASFYNPMNRDLRTVVETPAEKAEREATTRKAAPSADPPATPEPVASFETLTPQEAAAIAAAVAQMKSADAPVAEYSDQIPGGSVPAEKLAVEAGPVEAVSADAMPAEVKSAAKEQMAAQASEFESKEKEKDKERDAELPATIAAGAEPEIEVIKSDPRWSAVPMALDNLEASSSLEQEMRQAYAAYSAYENEPVHASSAPEPASASAPMEPSYSSASATEAVAAEAPVAAMASPEGEPASPQVTPAFIPEASMAESQSAQRVEAAIVTNSPAQDATPELVQAESAPAGSQAEITHEAFAEPNLSFVPTSELAAADAAPMAVEQSIAEAVMAASVTEEISSVPLAAAEIVPSIEVATSHVEADAAAQSPTDQPAEAGAYAQPESEVVKNTAAAWATWRQTRDADDSQATSTADDKSHEIDMPQPPESAAMAVAAGAEQIPQQVSSPVSGENPADVASIVDSVLADLRPRLMEEISRKMGQKK